MANPMELKSWSPYLVGAGIGVLSWFAFATANHPLGITTAFENTAALSIEAVSENEQANSYFADQEKKGKPPKIGWEWMLVAGVFLGAFLSSQLSGDREPVRVPEIWKRRFGDSARKRFVWAFLGAGLMMFGARLAEGCTSGHGLSGTLQLAVSSWVFITLAFLVSVILAFAAYGTEGANHV